MSETKDTVVSEVETAVTAYESAETSVLEAKVALERAQALREEKKAEAKKSLDDLMSRFESIGDSVQDAALDVVEKVETKIDEAKDEWAKLALTDPDAARRQLRKFWILVAGCSGIFIGGLGASLIAWIF